MKVEFICYPKCSTCQKAKIFLMHHSIDFIERHIVEDQPSSEEILSLMTLYEGEPKKFFNTSGKVYRELGLKDKVKEMNKEEMEEMAEILSRDGMLIKRPIFRIGNKVLVGFKVEIWEKVISEME